MDLMKMRQGLPRNSSMDGLINLDKPTGITSARALYRVRGITGVRKSGHAGTLDPAASGVLLICLGKATKCVEELMNLPKVYHATARLDVTSDSHDADRPMLPVPVPQQPQRADVEAACRNFEGVIAQVPPRVSAVKVGGTPAYKRARRDESFELRARPVRVYWVSIRRFDWPELDFSICCGRGTYVRALIRDIGARLGTGGCLTGLVRAQVGPFLVENAWTLDRLRQAEDPAAYLVSMDCLRDLLSSADMRIPARPSGE